MKKGKSKTRWRKVKNPRIFTEEEIAPRNIKVDVHMKLDADLVEHFRDLANKLGKGYQTLINEHLRRSVLDEHNLEERVQKLENALHAVGVNSKIGD